MTKCHGGSRRHLTNLSSERSPKINGRVVKVPTRVFFIDYVPSLRKHPILRDVTTGFPAKWRLRNEPRNSILMTCHYPDLVSASDWLCREGTFLQPIRSRLTFDCFLRPSLAKSVYQYVMLIRLSYCLWSVIAALNFFNIAPWCDPTEPL